jgi:hypothetical protein
VALPETRVADLQEWTKGRYAAIAIVSEDTATRFDGCLPPAMSLSSHSGPAH